MKQTSIEAYKALVESGMLSERRAQVYQLVRLYPGSTAGELSTRFYHHFKPLGITCAVETPHKRLSELVKLGFVKEGDTRECNDSHRNRTTYYPKQEAQQ